MKDRSVNSLGYFSKGDLSDLFHGLVSMTETDRVPLSLTPPLLAFY